MSWSSRSISSDSSSVFAPSSSAGSTWLWRSMKPMGTGGASHSILDDTGRKPALPPPDDHCRGRTEAEGKAKEEAERLAIAEVERNKREDEDRLHRLQSEKERQVREEQMKLEAEKHRTQVEAASRLEEARIHAEVQATAAGKKA